MIMAHNPYFGATEERGDSGHKRRQSFLWAEVHIFSGPGVMTADQSSSFGGDVGGLEQQCTAGGGRILFLSGVEMDGLWIWLRGRCGAVGYNDADVQWPHDIHPNQDWGDSRPMMTIKQARPRASPHWRLRCWVFPAIWSGLPWAPWTNPSKGFKGPHWARYYHHTKNPMQVTEAPVSTRRRTGMPSRLSWPVMGGPTAHPTGVNLASGDPSNSLTVCWGELGSRPRIAAAPVFVLKVVRERWCALADEEGAGELDGPSSWR